MSRFFNGGTAADRIVFSRGNAPPDQGPITMAVLGRPTSVVGTGWAVNADDGSFARWGLLLSPNPFIENDFGSGGPALTANNWYWLVATKASGSVIPRWHIKNVSTAGAWTHVDDSATVTDLTGVATEIIVGGQFTGGAGTTWRGQMAALAAWSSVLTDVQVEAACTLAAADLLAASPGWMIRLNQASTATAVTDDTGGGGDQTSISGTAVDAGEPPGWSYSLTPPPVVLTTIPAGTGPAGAPVGFTAGHTLTIQPAGTAPVGAGLLDVRGHVLNVSAAVPLVRGGRATLTAATPGGVTVSPNKRLVVSGGPRRIIKP